MSQGAQTLRGACALSLNSPSKVVAHLYSTYRTDWHIIVLYPNLTTFKFWAIFLPKNRGQIETQRRDGRDETFLSRPRPEVPRPRPRPYHPRPRPSWGVLVDPWGQGQASRTTRLIIWDHKETRGSTQYTNVSFYTRALQLDWEQHIVVIISMQNM